MLRLVKVTYATDLYMGETTGPHEKLFTIDDSLYPGFRDIECRIYDYFNEISEPYEEIHYPTRIEVVEHIV